MCFGIETRVSVVSVVNSGTEREAASNRFLEEVDLICAKGAGSRSEIGPTIDARGFSSGLRRLGVSASVGSARKTFGASENGA